MVNLKQSATRNAWGGLMVLCTTTNAASSANCVQKPTRDIMFFEGLPFYP